MTAYNFKKMFVHPIERQFNPKAQTIRGPRKRHARPGEMLQLYTAQRTRYCRLIGTATCSAVVPIVIDLPANCIRLDGTIYQGWDMLDPFARLDGFEGWLMMRDFWLTTYGEIVFEGVLIRWTDFVKAIDQ